MLLKFRNDNNLTQVKLAQLLPAKLRSIQYWESGKVSPPKFLIRALRDLQSELKLEK